MPEQFRDVQFTEDESLKIRGERYEFSEGDVAALPQRMAAKTATWGVADIVSGSYEVAEQNVQDSIGIKDSDGDAQRNNSDDDNDEELLADFLQDATVSEAQEYIDEHEDDTEKLEQILSTEEANENRKGVVSYVQDKLSEQDE